MGLILCGDFNHLPIKPLTNSHPDMKQVNKEKTRGDSILDLIITNLKSQNNAPTSLAPLDSSDHKCLLFSPSNQKREKAEMKWKMGRTKGHDRKEALAWCMANTDWTPVYEAVSIDSKAETLNSIIHTALDVCMPMKRKKTTSLDKPWMTEQIKVTIRKRQKTFNRWGKTEKWKRERNKVQRQIKEAKKNYYTNHIQDLKKKNPKEWWDYINKGLGRIKTSGGNICFDGVEDDKVADALNSFFAEAWINSTPLNIFPLPQPTGEEVLCNIGQMKQALTRLCPRKSCGPDGIPAWLLKEHAEDLAPILTHIVNYSYMCGRVPTTWKTSNVRPIPKGSNPSAPSDWRPISLTSCLGKVQESFIMKKLMPTVLSNCKNQYAYLPKASTTTALVRATHSWLTATDTKQPTVVRVLLADMSKAFDRVDHAKLLQHLVDMNLCPRLLAWIHSYTTGRRQRVMANDIYSSWTKVTSGVPQGGVVSPYLFLLYMSIRKTAFSDTLDTGYADDVGLSRAIPLTNIYNDRSMEMEAKQLDDWAADNNMQLNGKKSVEMRICFSKNPPQLPPLFLGGQEVPIVTTTKYLGFHLDSDLSGNTQVDQTVKKASKRLHFLTVLARQGLPCEDLVTIYTTLIRPCLEYGGVILVGCNKKQTAQLERVQRRAIRIISRGSLIQPKLPSLQSRREEAAIKLVKDMTDIHHPLHDLLPQDRASCTGRTLRSGGQLTTFSARTNRLRTATLPTAVRLFNTQS